MSNIIRRDALCTLAGGVATMICGPSVAKAAAASATPDNQVTLATGTFTPSQADGRKLVGFLETGVEGGHAFCSLEQQSPENPMIMSVFAAPSQLGRKHGVKVTLCFFAEPRGEVTFNVLHVGQTGSRSTAAV